MRGFFWALLPPVRRVFASPRPSRRELILVASAGIAAMVLYALSVGQDFNWDQRNYHVYVAHAWLTGTGGLDVAPAQIQSWLNPLGYVLQYLAMLTFPPLVVGGILGGASGLNAAAVYALAMTTTSGDGVRRRIVAGLAAATALSGPLFLSEVGTTLIDGVLGTAVSAALLAVAGATTSRTTGRAWAAAWFAAGILLGSASGIKLTFALYAMAFLGAAGLAFRRRFGLDAGMALLLGLAAGWTATGGYWSAKLWMEYGNPFFPFYNSLFRSPFIAPEGFGDPRFLPSGILDALSYPFQWAVGRHPSSELEFRELRFALLLVVIPLAVALDVRRLLDPTRAEPDRAVLRLRLFVLLFAALSFVLWIGMFAIQRYFIPIEALAGLLVFLGFEGLAPGRRRVVAAFALVAVAAFVWNRTCDWGRQPYSAAMQADWYEGRPSWTPLSGTLYVMVGGTPFSYVVPLFAPESRFVRIHGNGYLRRLDPSRDLGARAAAVIAEHRGEIRSLSSVPLDEPLRRILERFGLKVNEGPCDRLRTRLDDVESCRLSHVRP